MNRNLKYLFLLAIVMLTPGFIDLVMAQPGPPSTGGQPPCWPPPCVPVDGGIGFLIAAGALYGGKKLLLRKGQ